MAFVELAPQQRRNTGFAASIDRPWPSGVQRIDIKLDVWGAGGAADPWTGIAQPFNDPALRAEGEVLVTFPDTSTQTYSAVWVGHADGNFGSTKPGSPMTEPMLSLDFTNTRIPVSARLTLRCIAGPITSGLSVQFG